MSLPKSVIEGKFEVLHKISEGGMGAVYKVRHILLDEPFVIKVIRPQHEGDKDLQERFLREAQAAIRLRHANIAEIHDFSIGEEGTAYIVMEFIEGATLKQILAKQGPPELSLTMEIAEQSLKALGCLHRRGYLHRDVSPDNLMLTRSLDDEPLIKLIDLGLAKRLEGGGDLTTTGMFLGKVRYSAPEHFKGEELDQRSDLYSFGVMLYQLLTGHLPIEGEEFSQFIAAHLFKPPRDFAETDPGGRVPPGLRRVVMQTLEKERDRRVATADELAQLLAPFRQPDEVSSVDLSKTIALAPGVLPDSRTPELPHAIGKKPRDVERSREASVARVEAHLASRELEEATAALAEAEREHGADDNTQELRTQLESLRRKERGERLKALLEKARRQIAVDEMEEALGTLQEAETLDAENVSVQALLAQVRTAVDRARVARPKRNRLIWGVAAAVALVGLAILGWFFFRPSAAQRSYDLAEKAVAVADWQNARQHLRKAIELDPIEKTKGPYLPHYLLGLVHVQYANDCVLALEAWAESERQGVVRAMPQYENLRNSRKKCQDEYRLDAKRVSELFQKADKRAVLLEEPDYESLWRESSELTQRAQGLLQEHEEVRTQLGDAEARQAFGEIMDLEQRVLDLDEDLEELLSELAGR